METQQPYDPAQALADAQGARERMAQRGQAPSYYYPALGLAIGLAVGGQAFGGALAVMGGIACAVVSGLLISRYQEATGMWFTYGQGGPRGRLLWGAYALVLVALMAAAVTVQLTQQPRWWGLILGGAAFGFTVVAGRAVEKWWQRRVRSGAASVSYTNLRAHET